MPPSMMDHPSDCRDLTITANHGDSLSGTVMIGNDSGLQYLDDGWRLTLGPWERLSQAARRRDSLSIDSNWWDG